MNRAARNTLICIAAMLTVGGAIWFFRHSANPDVRIIERIGDGFKASALTQRYSVDVAAKKLNVVLTSAANAGTFGSADVPTYLCEMFASQRSVDATQPDAPVNDDWELVLEFEDGKPAGSVRLKRCIEGQALPLP